MKWPTRGSRNVSTKTACLGFVCIFFIWSFVLLNNLRGSDLLFQDLWKIWHQPQNKRHKTNRGKKRVTWYAETKAAHAAEEDDDEWPWWEPETHTPLWRGGRDWNDNPGSGHASSSSSRSRGRWQWAWVSSDSDRDMALTSRRVKKSLCVLLGGAAWAEGLSQSKEALAVSPVSHHL